ncbi:MAG TPA: hypothetical protein VD997_14985 [Phycisphaerales bacterium]|nr:hypothetical protein [Phycisphaerales bacterium]
MQPHDLTKLDDLLHDSRLRRVHSPRPDQLELTFHALRAAAGAVIEAPVLIRFDQLRAVGLGYDTNPAVRPSQLRLATRPRAEDLARWPGVEADCFATGNVTTHGHSLIDDLLLGTPEDFTTAPVRISFLFEQPWRAGGEHVEVDLNIAAGAISAIADGAELPVDTWERQYDEWWRLWSSEWEKPEGPDHPDLAAAIPGGKPDARPPTPPPDQPAFEVSADELPAELAAPLRDWYEGSVTQDWHRVAASYLNICISAESRANDLEQTAVSLQSWPFARMIDDWWIEGKAACVAVRGIEHSAGDDGGEALESVWTFSLVQTHGAWKIRTHMQGWPAYRSAKRIAWWRKPWKRRWPTRVK